MCVKHKRLLITCPLNFCRTQLLITTWPHWGDNNVRGGSERPTCDQKGQRFDVTNRKCVLQWQATLSSCAVSCSAMQHELNPLNATSLTAFVYGSFSLLSSSKQPGRAWCWLLLRVWFESFEGKKKKKQHWTLDKKQSYFLFSSCGEGFPSCFKANVWVVVVVGGTLPYSG